MMPPTTQEEIDASNKYNAYRHGWNARDAGEGKNPKMANHNNEAIRTAYHLGYDTAILVKNDAMIAYAKAVGYDIAMSILR